MLVLPAVTLSRGHAPCDDSLVVWLPVAVLPSWRRGGGVVAVVVRSLSTNSTLRKSESLSFDFQIFRFQIFRFSDFQIFQIFRFSDFQKDFQIFRFSDFPDFLDFRFSDVSMFRVL